MLRMVYPIILSKDNDGYLVNIPDFDIDTEGKDIAEAIFMARDAIGIMSIEMLDNGEELPITGAQKYDLGGNDFITYVDIDIDEYRRKHDNRVVRKNCTIPFYLCKEAEKQGINFSRVLQEALSVKLGINC